jgi:16S rRNA (cytidine1402-2'-O)-methyltransferase
MQEILKTQNANQSFFLPPALYVVATPIGNVSDITLRAIEILQKCDTIICEDSRVSGNLLRKLQIKKPLIIYNDHSNEDSRKKILELIKSGKSMALISDAGTPLISDPGYKLVSLLLENNIKAISIPGACSAIAALSISGIESNRFLFAGFIPSAKSEKESFLKDIGNIQNSTLIFFETSHRIVDSLKMMLKIFGNQMACVAREITKLYEETKKDSLKNLAQFYENNKIKGEIVILVSPKKDKESKVVDFIQVDKELKLALKTMKPKEAVALVADNYKLNKKDLYQRMLKLLEV